jgi:hypothetical protein
MLGTVLARRIIAATYVPAFGAAPQVKPPAAAGQALDAAIPTWSYCGIDSPSASVVFLHCAYRHRARADSNASSVSAACASQFLYKRVHLS